VGILDCREAIKTSGVGKTPLLDANGVATGSVNKAPATA
jgi:hypothetical protein